MIKIKNIQTSEVINVLNVVVENGQIISEARRPHKGSRFYRSYSMVMPAGISEDDRDLHVLADGWELVQKCDRKPRQPKAKKDAPKAKSEQPAAAETVTDNDPQPETTEQPEEDTTNEQTLIAALKNLRGGAVDIAKVREIVAEELSKLAAMDAKKAAKVIEAAKKNSSKKNEVYCAKFKRIVAKVSRGNNVYLFGPAGSGKSHTAEQVADALGLDFYGQTTIQFAHDVRGYGDAGGVLCRRWPHYKHKGF